MAVERRRVCCRAPGMIVDTMRAGRRSRALGWWHAIHGRGLRPRRSSSTRNLRPVSGRCVSYSGPIKRTSPRPREYAVSKQYSLWCAAYMDMASRRSRGRKGGGESDGDRVAARSDSRARSSKVSRSRAVLACPRRIQRFLCSQGRWLLGFADSHKNGSDDVRWKEALGAGGATRTKKPSV